MLLWPAVECRLRRTSQNPPSIEPFCYRIWGGGSFQHTIKVYELDWELSGPPGLKILCARPVLRRWIIDDFLNRKNSNTVHDHQRTSNQNKSWRTRPHTINMLIELGSESLSISILAKYLNLK
jgi:hypothetical protein